MKIINLLLTFLFPLTSICQELTEKKPVPEAYHIESWTEDLSQFEHTFQGTGFAMRKTDGTVTITDSSVVIEMPKKEKATYKILSYSTGGKHNQEGILIKVLDGDNESQFAIAAPKKEGKPGQIIFLHRKGKSPVYYFR